MRGKSVYVVTNLLNGEGKFKPSGLALLLRLKQANFDCKMLIIYVFPLWNLYAATTEAPGAKKMGHTIL